MGQSADFKNYIDPAKFISGSNFSKGLQYNHNFLVTIVPGSGKIQQTLSSDDISFNAFRISVPGVKLGFTGSIISGRNRYFAQERGDQDLSILFIDDSSMSIRRYFEKWISIAYDPYTKLRCYPDDYKASAINIFTLSQTGESKYLDQFIMPFPVAINDLNFERSNYEITRTSVTFKYQTHLVKSYDELNKSIEE